MDDKDHALITLLTRDARMSAAALARRLGLSRTTVQARIERLERSGAILGYTARLGEPGWREMIRATVLISVEPRMTARVVAALGRLEEVERLHTTSGRWDMVAQMAAPTTEALDAALDRAGLIEGVRAMETLVKLATKVDRTS
jgi:DNA-binding Lrp family transcriptional regulator